MNPLRGEVEVELFGKKHVLTPDHQSIMEIEDAANGELSVPLMLIRATKGATPLKTIGLVLYGCLKARGGKDEYTLDQIYKEVRARGIPNYLMPVNRLLRSMCTPEEAEAEVKKSEPASETSEKVAG